MEKNQKKSKGITLIALVVTIVVLLILAGISIAMLSGENGIITKAIQAKEDSRGGEVKELVDLAVSENKMIIDGNEGEKTTKQEMIAELKGKLTDEEVAKLADEDTIKIGNIEIDFSKLNGTEMITFTVKDKFMYDEEGNYIYGEDGWAIMQDTTYKVPKGITWGEFINSEYNTAGYQARWKNKYNGEWEDSTCIWASWGTWELYAVYYGEPYEGAGYMEEIIKNPQIDDEICDAYYYFQDPE